MQTPKSVYIKNWVRENNYLCFLLEYGYSCTLLRYTFVLHQNVSSCRFNGSRYQIKMVECVVKFS